MLEALRLRFRRRTPAPGEHDARALEIANRQIWRLEMRLTAALHRIDRLIAGHVCPAGVELVEAYEDLLRTKTQLGEALREQLYARQETLVVYRRLHEVLATIDDDLAPTQPIAVIDAREPR